MSIIIDDEPEVESPDGQNLRVPGPTGASLLPEAQRLYDEARAGLQKDFPGIQFAHRLGAPAEVDTDEFTLGAAPVEDFNIGGLDVPVAPAAVAAPPPEETQGWFSSMARGLGERAVRIVGFIPDTANTIADLLPDWLDQGLVVDKDGIRWAKGDNYSEKSFAGFASQGSDEIDLGSQNGPLATTDEIKAKWAGGDKWGAAGSAAQFALEQGILSLPDMLAVIGNFPLYTIGAAGDYAQQRATNDGRAEANAGDAIAGAVTSVFVSALEKYGADKVFDMIGGAGKTAARRWLEGIAAEAVTEAIQNPAEFAATRMGTAKAGEVTPRALAEESAFGALGGAGGGAAIGAPVQLLSSRDQPAPTPAPPQVAPAPPPAAPPPSAAPAPSAPPATAAAAPSGAPKVGDAAMFQPNPSAPGIVVMVEKVTPGGITVTRVDPETGDPAVDKDGNPATFVATLEDLKFVGGVQSSAPSPVTQTPAAAPAEQNPPADTTAEPVLDLVAQVKDMYRAGTPRRGVYVSPATVDSMKANGTYPDLLKQGVHEENFDGQGGTLIVKSKKDLDEARFARDSGMVDMQAIIGKLTGAGIAKPKTKKAAVVQRKDEAGGVVQQSAVIPAEVPAAVAEQSALPGQVEVTTPEAVIAERAQRVAEESIPVVEAPAKPKAKGIFEQLDEAFTFATTTLNTPKDPESLKGRKPDVRASAAGVAAAAQMLRLGAVEARKRGAPPDIYDAAINAAARSERFHEKTDVDFARGRGVSEPILRARMVELRNALETLKPYREAARVAEPVKGEALKKGKKAKADKGKATEADKVAAAVLAKPSVAEGVKEDLAKNREKIEAPVKAAEEAARAEMPPKVREVVEKAEKVFTAEQERRKTEGASPTGQERRAQPAPQVEPVARKREVLEEYKGYAIERGPPEAGVTFQARVEGQGLAIVGAKSIEDLKALIDEKHPTVGPTGMQVAPPGEKVVHRKKKFVVKKPAPTPEQVAEKVAEDTAPQKVETIDIVPAAILDQQEFVTDILGAAPQELQREISMDKSGRMYGVMEQLINAMKDRGGWTGWFASVTRGGVMPRTHRNQMLTTIREYAAANRQDLPAVREQLLGLLTNIEGKTLPQQAISAVFEAANLARAYTTMAENLRSVDEDVNEIEEATSDTGLDKTQLRTEGGTLTVRHEKEIGGKVRGSSEPLSSGDSFRLMLAANKGLHPLHRIYRNVAQTLHATGVMRGFAARSMQAGVSKKNFPTSHEMLDIIINALHHTADTHSLLRIVTKIRAVSPNVPVEFLRANEVALNEEGKPIETNARARYFPSGLMQMQVHMDSRGLPVITPDVIQSTVHELTHAATVYELKRDPHGRLAREISGLRHTIIERAKQLIGEKDVEDSIAFYSGHRNGEVPDAVKRRGSELYGLTNNMEFVAEIFSNPRFHNFLMQLDQSPTKTWARRMWNSFVRLLNQYFRIPNPADNRLLNDALVLGVRVMDAQARRLNRMRRAVDSTIEMLVDVLRLDREGARRVAKGLYSAQVYEEADAEKLLPQGQKDRAGQSLLVAASVAEYHRIKQLSAYDMHLFGLNEMGPDARSRLLHNTRAAAPDPSLEPLSSPSPRLKNHEQIARITSPRLASAAGAVRRLIRSRAVDRLRDSGLGFLSTDFLVSRSARLFGTAVDAANPLVAWKRLRDVRRSYANQLSELAEKTVNSKWMKLTARESEQFGNLVQNATLWQIDPSQGRSQPKLIGNLSQKRWEAKVDELHAEWGRLTPAQQELYHATQKYFQTEYARIRRAGIDLAVDLYGGGLTDAQRTLLYTARDTAQVDKLVGPGQLIDLSEGNDKFLKVLHDLIRVSAIKGPYFPLMRDGHYVVEANRTGTLERTFDTKAEANAVAVAIRARAPKNKAKVHEAEGKYTVDFDMRHVSFHKSQAEANAAMDELRAAGFGAVGNVFTRKLESVESASLTEGLKELLTKAESVSAAGGTSVEQQAISQTLQSAFMQILAERAASASQQLKRQGVAGFKGKEAHEIFARRVRASSWHYANLKTALAQSKALSRIRTFSRDPYQGASPPNMAPQDLALARGRVLHEVTERLRVEADELGSLDRSSVGFLLGQLGFVNFLLTPSYTLVNAMQNVNVAMPYIMGKYGARGGKALLRGMKVVMGPTFGNAVRGLFSKPGEVTSYDVYTAIATAVGEHPRYARFTESSGGRPSALQELVDLGVINASFIQELSAVANNQNLQVSKGMEYLRLFPQAAELMNRVSTALAILEVTNGDVDAAADVVRKVHFSYELENRPRFFRRVGIVRLPQAITMFKMYGVGVYQLGAALTVDAVSRRGQSKAERARAASALAGIIAAHTLSAGVIGGIMIEPLRLLMQAWAAAFGDDDEFFDLDTMVQNWATEVTGSEMGGRVVSRGVWNALGFDLSSRMGLDRILMYNTPESSDAKDIWKFVGSLLGPLPAMAVQKIDRINELIDQGRYGEAILEGIPVRLLQDARKAWELQTEGVRSRSGETVVGPENFGAIDSLGRLAGFQTTEEGKVGDQADTTYTYKGWRAVRVRQLSNQLWNAYDSGDRAAYAAATAAIKRFNDKNPGAPITRQSLLQSKRAEARAVKERSGEGRNRDLNELLAY